MHWISRKERTYDAHPHGHGEGERINNTAAHMPRHQRRALRVAARTPRAAPHAGALAIDERYMPHGIEKRALVIGRSLSGMRPKLTRSAAIQ